MELMISNRLKKIEAKIKDMDRKDYRYIFGTREEYEQGKIDGIVDPESHHCLILDDLEKEQ